MQRRGGNRAEIDSPEPTQSTVPPQPVAESLPQVLPPRRNWSRSMLEIAKQLARLDLAHHSVAGELPPEIVFIEPIAPEVKPEVQPAPPAEQNRTLVVEAPVEPVGPTIELPASAPQAIADLWPIDGAILAQSSLVSLADAETWLALPVAPAVTCTENLADGWIAALSPDPVAEEDRSAKKHRKLRIDGSHTRLPRPHQKPVVEIHAEEVKSEIAETIVSEPTAKIDVEAEVAQLEPKAVVLPAVEPPVVVTPVVAAVETPVVESAPLEPAVPEPTVPKRPYIPLWEVDRFTWPALCDKLMHDPNGYFASASQKLLSVVRGGLKVLGITGSRRGEGRTTLALCLARAAAQAGIHVALVDADFARPQLATMLGLETAYGWQEAATGKIPLSEAAVKSLADRLTVLPLEVSTTSAPLSLADPRVTATLRATAATFELVIVDLGPLGATTEVLFPPGESCPLDAAVVVRDTRYASVNESRLAGDRLYDAGIEAVGIAENFVTQPELSFL